MTEDTPNAFRELPSSSHCANETPKKINPRELVFHEVGHVAMQWFLGHEESIHLIDMRGNGMSRAIVKRSVPELTDLRALPGPDFMRSWAVCNTLVYLAGPAAEYKYWGFRADGDWLRDLFSAWECTRKNPLHDIGQSIACAKKLYRKKNELYGFLTTVAAWTREALDIPEVWGAVIALADRLEVQKTMKGSVAARILRAAGQFKTSPVNDLGQPWWERCRIQPLSSPSLNGTERNSERLFIKPAIVVRGIR